ncbi:MAG: nitrite reductase small subunit NirD [Gammaproteobacteria bacterium]|nr:nitrite reductase small subunit NirD [Gammaproteobacteria bacterium]MDH5801360.1 nitrite reductase small subunit NirD [Gammaproteobacteria bacterium]
MYAEEKLDWIYVGKLDDIPMLGARVINTDEGDIAIFRNSKDEVFALRDQCPHKGGKLSQGIVHGRSVTCPLHNWVLGLDDGEAKGPDVGCAQRFAVKLEGDCIMLCLTPGGN